LSAKAKTGLTSLGLRLAQTVTISQARDTGFPYSVEPVTAAAGILLTNRFAVGKTD
jgi:hypothetical protein